MMKTLIMVALGGALGACLRYLVGLAVGFPLGTLAVNVAGSLAIGVVWVTFADKALLLPFLMTGLLGGFTTYSSFSLETWTLIERGQTSLAAFYVALTLVAAFLGLIAGVHLMRTLL